MASNYALNTLLDPSSGTTLSDAQSTFAKKADLSEKVSQDAFRLVRIGQFEGPFKKLVARACELLDYMDELLVAMHPFRDRGHFATAAALHRNLERLQEAVTTSTRGHTARSKTSAGRT
jgi:hypothetical protein